MDGWLAGWLVGDESGTRFWCVVMMKYGMNSLNTFGCNFILLIILLIILGQIFSTFKDTRATGQDTRRKGGAKQYKVYST